MIIYSLCQIARELKEDPRISEMGVKVKINYEDEEFEFLEEDVSVSFGNTKFSILRAYSDDDFNFTFILCNNELWEYEMFIDHLQELTNTHNEDFQLY